MICLLILSSPSKEVWRRRRAEDVPTIIRDITSSTKAVGGGLTEWSNKVMLFLKNKKLEPTEHDFLQFPLEFPTYVGLLLHYFFPRRNILCMSGKMKFK
jgi:hypothetical protein